MNKLVRIITIIAGAILLKDFISLMSGASFTTLGVITAFINFIILAAGCDYLEF